MNLKTYERTSFGPSLGSFHRAPATHLCKFKYLKEWLHHVVYHLMPGTSIHKSGKVDKACPDVLLWELPYSLYPFSWSWEYFHTVSGGHPRRTLETFLCCYRLFFCFVGVFFTPSQKIEEDV